MKKRKVIKGIALAVCIGCSAAIPVLFGIKASAMNLLEMCAFAIWAATDWAEREDEIMIETLKAVMNAYSEEDALDEAF